MERDGDVDMNEMRSGGWHGNACHGGKRGVEGHLFGFDAVTGPGGWNESSANWA